MFLLNLFSANYGKREEAMFFFYVQWSKNNTRILFSGGGDVIIQAHFFVLRHDRRIG